jgi:hypothetical protein
MGEADPGGNAFERDDKGSCLIGKPVDRDPVCVLYTVDEHTHGVRGRARAKRLDGVRHRANGKPADPSTCGIHRAVVSAEVSESANVTPAKIVGTDETAAIRALHLAPSKEGERSKEKVPVHAWIFISGVSIRQMVVVIAE